MTSLEDLEKRISEIEKRNRRVETDKKWETSLVRRTLLFLFTYLSIAIYFLAVGIDRPFFNAMVPAVGFWLSTLTLPFFRKLWEKGK